jgi:hypothetical protein
MTTILPIERLPGYWIGRRAVRADLADHGDQSNHDALTAAEYDKIISALGTGTPLEEIPDYLVVADRRMTWAPLRQVETLGFGDDLEIP